MPAKMVAGYRINSSLLQATYQFNPNQPTEILSMKKHWLSNQTLRRGRAGRKQRTKKKFYRSLTSFTFSSRGGLMPAAYNQRLERSEAIEQLERFERPQV
jgi:hypothetical protein